MALVTTCPQCLTAFRVVSDQLKVANGHVRCGRCGHVFDARLHLREHTNSATEASAGLQRGPATEPVAEPRAEPVAEVAAEPSTEPVTAPVTQPVAEQPVDASAAPAVSEAAAVLPSLAAPTSAQASSGEALTVDVKATSPSPAVPEASDAPSPPEVVDTPPSAMQPSTAIQPSASAAPAGSASEPSSQPAPPDWATTPVEQGVSGSRTAQRVWPWVLAALALTLVASAQLVYAFRDDLAARAPTLAPALRAACAPLACQISPPAWVHPLVVEASNLIKTEGSSAHRLELTVRNNASLAVRMPAFELTLSSVQGERLARRVLSAQEMGAGDRAFLPAGTSLKLAARLQFGSLPVAGYTIEVFQP
jgi:predicted Zn finger-like uncharacterized protein